MDLWRTRVAGRRSYPEPSSRVSKVGLLGGGCGGWSSAGAESAMLNQRQCIGSGETRRKMWHRF